MKPLQFALGETVAEQNARVQAFADSFEIGSDGKAALRNGDRYNARYAARYGARYEGRYSERYGIGAPSSSVPTTPGANVPGGYAWNPPPNGGVRGQCSPYVTGQCGAAHGRRVVYVGNYSCGIRPPRCDCQVIGGNTLNSSVLPTGVASGAFATVQLDSGDASFFVPYYMSVIALEVGATANLSTTGAPLMVLMQNSLSGREPNMRRASDTTPSFGVPTSAYGDTHLIECVDWNRFASVNNQQLRITFFNPQTVAVHIFVDLWGTVAAA